MNIVGAMIAGLFGTAVMTLLMALAPMMGMPKMNVIGMLGTMATADQGTATAIGTVTHFVMGVIFAIIYAALWSLGIGSPTALSGVLFGLVHGLIAALAMPMMLRMHPRPPGMSAGPMMVTGLLVGHVAYGLVVALIYGQFVA
ncbi:MAG: hypothetical protein M5U01_28595 [Ardenticatenaceae bacterium]|nr:hypothetical protein [Ardenticatenaceae bacterium]HBY92821.1 hypothetical protein [Chloroflexota bacterium]